MVKNKTVELALSALGAVLIAVCSWFTIPAAVPFTLQTFAVYCVLCLFGAKTGLCSVAVYILMGVIGVPVFSGFSSGIGVLLGATGGYIVGFVFMVLVYGLIKKFTADNVIMNILALLIGTAICYAFGTAWFMVVYAKNTGAIGLTTALMWCVVPFIVPDIAKTVAAVLISQKLKPLVFKK